MGVGVEEVSGQSKESIWNELIRLSIASRAV